MTMQILPAIVFLGIAIFIVSCATGEQTDRPYQEIGRAHHFKLQSDGLIIGFEKRSIRNENKEILGKYEGLPLYANLAEPLGNEDGANKKRNKLFRRYAYFNSKIMIPTQIVSQFDGVQEYEYNIYEENTAGVYNYETAYKELSAVFERLRDSGVGSGKYTHIIVLNMGWNNDQTESMWRYNRIIKNLQSLENKTATFNPFVVAITWPSGWRSINDFSLSKKLFHLISYPNKTLDADELGVAWLNWIINDQLPALRDSVNSPKIVLIGHSLGARILTRALFSTEHLLENKKSDAVDLLIGLQPAFSALRFVKGHGLEGYPYAEFADKKTRLVFTASVRDKANPIANYITGAKHLGGKQGLAFAKEHSASSDNHAVFDIHTWTENSLESPPEYNGRVNVIDASSIVIGSKNPKLSAHNDVLDEAMAKLIWHHISAL